MEAPQSSRLPVSGSVAFDPDVFRSWCRLLYVPGDVFQVLVRDGARTWSGVYHYNDLDDLVAHLQRQLDGAAEPVVLLTVNPVKAVLLSRGQLSERDAVVVAADMRERRWLPVVIDGDAAEALDLTTRLVSTLGAEGWPAPIILEAPARVVALFRIRLRNDREDADVVTFALRTLSQRFLGITARVSDGGSSAEWMVGAPGTGAPGQHWRVARTPAVVDLVTRDRLMAGRVPEVQSVPAWEKTDFEAGLDQLDRVFADTAVSVPPATTRDSDAPPPPTTSSATTPDSLFPTRAMSVASPAPVVVMRPGLRPLSTPLPVTDFEEALERYRLQHQDQGARIVTGFAQIDDVAGGMRGLVTLDGSTGEGRSSMAFQIAMHALLDRPTDAMVVVIASFGLRRAEVTDRLMSHVSGLSLDVLHHGRSRRKATAADGLRLDARERRRLNDAKAQLQAIQSRLFIVDADWVERLTSGSRPKDGLGGVLGDAKRSAGARRGLCVVDDFAGWADLFPRFDPVDELLAITRVHTDDVLMTVTSGGSPDALQRRATARLVLSRRTGEAPTGQEPMRLSLSTRRSGAIDAHADLRFVHAEHRFEADQAVS
jgi:DnaB-like helicase C terminal domain